MARNPRGVPAQASSPASAPIRACHPGGATGTASTTRTAPAARAIWQAARAVDPVAMPSPATTAIRRPARPRGPVPPGAGVRLGLLPRLDGREHVLRYPGQVNDLGVDDPHPVLPGPRPCPARAGTAPRAGPPR